MLDISAVFYMAFDYIPRLERDVDRSYKRIDHLIEARKKKIKNVSRHQIEEAIEANERLIRAYTRHRLFKVYFPLLLLSIPLLVLPLSIIFPVVLVQTDIANCIWSLMFFFGVFIPFVTSFWNMFRNRPYTRFENIHREELSQMIHDIKQAKEPA